MKKFAIFLSSTSLMLLGFPVLAAEAPPTQQIAKHYSTQETTIDTLLADPAAKRVIDKHIPGLSTNPQISMAGAMTLFQISQMAPDQIKKEMLTDIDADLAKLPAK